MANNVTERASFQAPFPLAMVICDAIWIDPATGKQTLLGCFTGIRADTFPVKYPAISLYVALTDGRGNVPISLRLVDASQDEKLIFEGQAEAKFDDPRVIVEALFHITNAEFPAAGEYRFQLFAGSEFVIERRLLVVQEAKK